MYAYRNVVLQRLTRAFPFLVLAMGANSAFASTQGNCANAVPLNGEGAFPFSAATWGEPPEVPGSCDDGMTQTAWFCWTAPHDGPVTVSTCGETVVDTTVAVFDGCNCEEGISELACNDDECLTQSEINIDAVEGRQYLIRIGAVSYAASGDYLPEGEFIVEYSGNPADCDAQQASDSCQAPDGWNALASDGNATWVADDFVFDAPHSIDGVCWWGTYLGNGDDCRYDADDAFTVTYYRDAVGLPGELHAGPFVQAEGSLHVSRATRTNKRIGGADREYGHTATHELVEFQQGVRYWIEVSNDLDQGCTWYWETAVPANGRVVQVSSSSADQATYRDALGHDVAYCFDASLVVTGTDAQPPVNDDCESSILIEPGIVEFDTSFATTDGPREYEFSCYSLEYSCCISRVGDTQVHRDIWYDFDSNCAGLVTVDVCESNFDTKLAVYKGADCLAEVLPPEPPLANFCSDDDCGGESISSEVFQSHVSFQAEPGTTYKIRVGGYGLYARSDCFASKPASGCSDALCAEAVCMDHPECCTTSWSQECADHAVEVCRGSGGLGLLSVELSASTPESLTLADYALLSTCFTGSCEEDCTSLEEGELTCCHTVDYDGDGDVDLDDFQSAGDAFDGPM